MYEHKSEHICFKSIVIKLVKQTIGKNQTYIMCIVLQIQPPTIMCRVVRKCEKVNK